MQTLDAKRDGRNEKKESRANDRCSGIFLETIEETFAVSSMANKCERIPLLTGLLVTVSRDSKTTHIVADGND